jgi:hypothetical protein
MAQVDDIEQVERELEAFRARAQDTLKSFDLLTELISEITKTSQAYEAEVGNAAEIADLLNNKLNEIDQNWLRLKSEVDEARELLSRSEIEREGRWVQYNKDNKKAQEELEASWQEVQNQLGQTVIDMQNDSNQHFAEVNRDLDLQTSRLDEIQQRWTTLDEDLAKTKNALIAADRNQRTYFEQMIADLRGDSEQHFAEVNRSLDLQTSRLDEIQQRWTTLDEDLAKTKNALIAADRNQRTHFEQIIADLRGGSEQHLAEVNRSLDSQATRLEDFQSEFDRRWTKMQEDGIKMQNDFQAAHGDLRTASWKMIDDLRGETEGRFSEINKSLTHHAAKYEEANEAIEARIVEANNRLARDFEQKNAIMELKIDRLQRMFWALLAIIIIIAIIIIYSTY